MQRSGFAGVAAFLLCAGVAQARPFDDPRAPGWPALDQAGATEARDPACIATQLVATGGASPRDRHTLAVRWAGVANFELAVDGKVLLLDAFYDRGSLWLPLGFNAANVVRADAILLGHGHFDHMADAASVGKRTGAIIVGAPVTTEKLATQGVDPKQVRTVTGKGGEALAFGPITVEPILARHGEPAKKITETMESALDSLLPPLSEADKEEQKAIMARGTSDPRVITEGTIAYLITLDDGFRILWRDSGGHVTPYERQAMARVGRVDLALVALSADYLENLVIAQALEHARLYRPTVFMPAHHDAPLGGHAPLWRATEPVFEALKQEDPSLVTVSREYGEPVCFNTEFNLSHGEPH